VPDVVDLGEAVEEEEGWAGTGAGLDAVDGDVWSYGGVEFFEAFEHFGDLKMRLS
jgi:hypothetical protein